MAVVTAMLAYFVDLIPTVVDKVTLVASNAGSVNN